MTEKQKTLIIAGLILIFSAIFKIDLPKNICTGQACLSPTVAQTKIEITTVTRVIDGDTIEIEGGRKVRYIGIDTPEILYDKNGRKTGEECFAQEATEENKKLVEGKMVRLEKDSSEKDRYGRLLRYVYVDSNFFVNESLIKNGYARLMMIKPDTKHYLEFKTDQENAKANNLGLWKACPIKY